MPKLCTYFCFFLPSLSPLLLAQDSILDVIPDLSAEAQDSFFAHYDGSKGVTSANGGVSSWTPVDLNGNSLPSFRLDAFSTGGVDSGGASPSDIVHDGDTLIFTDSSDPAQTRRLQLDLESGLFTESSVIWQGQYDSGGFFENSGSYAFNLGPNQSSHQRDDDGGEGFNIELFRGSTTYIGESISIFDGNTTNWTTIATETGHTAFANNINLNVGETPTPTPNDLPGSSQLIVGAFSSSGFDFVGEMKHLILFQTALSEADRVLINRFLNTTVVTNSDPEGPGSLRAALANASDTIDARITFDPTLSGSIIRLGGSELLIDRSLTIDASNLPEGIIIDGGGDEDFVQDIDESRCIRVSDADFFNTITVTLNNLTLQNGSLSNSDGANLFNDAEDVTLIDCQVLGGRAFGNRNVDGGGIFNLSGNLRMENCIVSGNKVQSDGPAGGGISSTFGSLTILNCFITGNQIDGQDAVGGGIYARGSSFAMESCSINDNRAEGDNALGGGIFTTDNAQDVATTLTRCTLSGNSAPNSQGGGLFNFSGQAILSHCTVTENTAGANAGGGLASPALRPFGELLPEITVTASIVAGNPGGDIVFSNGDSNPFASGGSNLIGDGNAVGAFNAGGDQTGITDPRLAPLADYGGPTLTHVPLPDSPAIDAASDSGSSTDQRGFPVDGLFDIGAVELQRVRVNTLVGSNTSNDNGRTSLRQAIEQLQPAPFDLITFESTLSGSIIRLGGSELLIDRSLIIDASDLPAGIIIDGGGNGNFIQEEVESRCIQISDGDSENAIVVTLNNLTLQNGSFEGQNAGANLFNDGEDITLIDCQILGGRAFSASTTFGAGVLNISGNLTMENCTVSGNQIEADRALGGGIASASGSLNILNCFITGNQTRGQLGGFGQGGGVYTFSSNITMENCSITENRTQGGEAQGGGIFTDARSERTTTLTRCTISGNSAPNSQGGGLFNAFGQARLTHCTVTENIAGSNAGGGLASSGINSSETTVTASIVAGNAGDDIVFSNGESTSFASGGSNLLGDGNAVAAFNAGGDQIGITDPRLAPLADNGGPTLTHLPLPDSPAIDAAVDFGSSTDQRGFPVDTLFDIGAVELQRVRVDTLAGENTINNNGLTSLRQAIEQFEPAPFDLITFDPDLSGSTIELGGSELLINRSLIIDASDLPDGIIIDGGGDEDFVQESDESRCIQISDGDSENAIIVTLNNLTLQNGSFEGQNAGANLFNNGEDVTLRNCQILNGRAFDDNLSNGGGILNLVGNLTMENCTVSGNQIEADLALGGGITNTFGNLNMLNCSITDNLTDGAVAQGGGIFNSSGNLLMENCSITDNRNEGNEDQGGGIFSDAGSGRTITLTRCTLSGNSAPNSQGGGLFNSFGPATLTHCTVTENIAGANAGGGLASSGDQFTVTTVTASIVAANSGGDVVFVLGGSNSFTSGGSNLIGDGNAVAAFNAEGDQTGITDPRLAPLADNGGPTLTHLPFPSSRAIDGASGSDSTIDQRGFPVDGLFDIGAVEVQRVRVNTFAGGNTSDSNELTSLRQAIEQFDPAPFDLITFESTLSGSIIRLGGSELLIDRSLTIDASNLPDGIIIDGGSNGNFVQEDGESRCIRVSDGNSENAITVTLNNLTLQNGSFESRNGGVNLFNDGEDITLIDCQILNGRAFDSLFVSGGGVLNLSGNLTMENCNVSGNQIQANDASGGGITSTFGNLNMLNCSVTDNLIQGDSAAGGGIASTSGTLSMLNCSVTGNQTQGEFAQGAGIRTFGGNLTMENCSITDNRTQGDNTLGGGIFSDAPFGQPTILTRCTLSGNSAPNSVGGGLFNSFGPARLIHCTVTENTAGVNAGGGLASFGNSPSETTVTASIVAANSGGDIVFINGGTNPFTSGGSNLIGDGNAVAAFNAGGDQAGITDPRLAPLSDYGGPTLTHLPLPDSPAIDAVSDSGSSTDQRGFPVDALVDIGAVEVQRVRVNTLAGENTINNNGLTSLRQAIEQFEPAPFDLITFESTLSGSIIRLGGSELLIDRSLTIDASNLPDGIIIDGGSNGNFVQEDGESRCIRISDGNSENAITVTLNNLTLQNGSFESRNAGANLLNDGEDITLIDCQILNGRAFSGASTTGGGILNLFGNLTMENCTVSGNQIQANQGFGGGIHSISGTLTIVNCFITGNLISIQTDGREAIGGGISSRRSSLTMESCSITDNRIEGENVQGGGISINASGLDVTAILTRCTISGNSAEGENVQGGGIFINASGLDVTAILTRCTISGNSALNSLGGDYQGGGLFISSGSVILTHCTVTENTAGPNAGGGLASFALEPIGGLLPEITVTASIVAANSGGDIVFLNNPFAGEDINPFTSGGSNLIGDGNAVGAFNAGGDQTGITDPRLAPLADYGGPTLTHLPLPDSPAIDAVSDSGSSTDQRGFPVDALVDIGAVEVQRALVNTLAGGNTSDNNELTSLRQAIEQFDPAPFDLITFESTLSGSIIRLGGSELLIDRSLIIDASNLSGGIIIDGGGDEDFMQDIDESRCMQISNGDSENAIIVTLNNLTLQNGYFAGQDAGANLFNDGENITLIDCQILGGRAFGEESVRGGGILNLFGNLTMENCTVSGNQIEADLALGGGVASTAGSLSILNCFITGNQTEGRLGGSGQGGGIRASNSNLKIENSSITDNRTLGGIARGGGIFSETAPGRPTSITRCTLSGNSATNSQGGGLFNNFGPATLTHCTVTENTAGLNAGGGLASFGDEFTVTTVTASIVAANTGGDIVFVGGANNSFTSEGSNLIGDGNAVGAFNAGGDQTGISAPLLAPLADNGGPTLTHLPLPSSLAIDGASGSESTIDQRGLPISDSSPDVGSVERQNFLEGFEQIFDEDVDGDGTSVGVELAIGTNPFRPDAGDERNLRILPFDSSGELQLTFGVDDDAQSEILLRLTRSINLIDFDEILSNQVNDFEGPVIFSDPNPPEGQAFYRLEAIGLNLTN